MTNPLARIQDSRRLPDEVKMALVLATLTALTALLVLATVATLTGALPVAVGGPAVAAASGALYLFVR